MGTKNKIPRHAPQRRWSNKPRALLLFGQGTRSREGGAGDIGWGVLMAWRPPRAFYSRVPRTPPRLAPGW